MICKSIFVTETSDDKLEIAVRFNDGDAYQLETLTIEKFIGDTPQDLASTLQKWVDHLNTL